MEINIREVDYLFVNLSPLGELRAAKCRSENGHTILILAIYIRVNQKIADIINFIHKQLLLHTPIEHTDRIRASPLETG